MRLYNLNRQQALLAAIGGMLIGTSISLFFIFYGKIFRMKSKLRDLQWNYQLSISVTIFAGVIFCSAFYMELYHQHYVGYWPYEEKVMTNETSPIVLVVAGFLAGLGSSLAQGGTYSHIFSGVSRLKLNSFIASIFIFGAGYYTQQTNLTASITSLTLNKHLQQLKLPKNIPQEFIISASMIVPFFCFLASHKTVKNLIKLLIAFSIGIIAGIGMLVGGEANRQYVLDMLHYDRDWNPRLLVSLVTAIMINLVVYVVMTKGKLSPVFKSKYEETTRQFSINTVIGSIMMGISWGLAGISLGSILLLMPMRDPKIIIYWGIPATIGLLIADCLRNINFNRKSIPKKS